MAEVEVNKAQAMALALLLTACLARGVAAQDSIDVLGSQARASFECSLLAMNFAEDYPSLAGEPRRLFEFGHAAAKRSWHGLIAMDSYETAFGPWTFLTEMSDDFFAGQMWSLAGNRVRTFLDSEVPIEPGITVDQRSALLGNVSYQEFQRRNCDVIGR